MEWKVKIKNVKEIIGITLVIGIMTAEALLTTQGGFFGGNNNKEFFKEKAVTEYKKHVVVLGKITDRNGKEICNLANVDFANGNYGEYTNAEMYAPFLGYIRSEKENSEGILRKYYDVLYDTGSIEETKGNDIQLTIDSDLQESVYQIMKDFVGNSKEDASIVVSDAENGEILAMVSLPTYNPEKELPKKYTSVVCDDPRIPGSSFKVLTSIALLENSVKGVKGEDYERINTPFRVTKTNEYLEREFIREEDEAKFIVNYDSSNQGEVLSYKKALDYSSNIFFAGAMLDMENAEVKLTNIMNRLTGEKVDDYGRRITSFDFGNVVDIWAFDKNKQTGKYNYDNDSGNMLYQRALADTAYGQGGTKLSTITEIRLVSAIANGGKAYNPYMIKAIKSAGVEKKEIPLKEIAEKHNIPELDNHNLPINVTTMEVADKIKSAMLYTCSDEEEHNYYNFQRENIGGKSGTGEVVVKEKDNLWFMSFCTVNGHIYSVVMNSMNEKAGARTGSGWASRGTDEEYSPLEKVYNEIEKLNRE